MKKEVNNESECHLEYDSKKFDSESQSQFNGEYGEEEYNNFNKEI